MMMLFAVLHSSIAAFRSGVMLADRCFDCSPDLVLIQKHDHELE